ncbi:DUF421 domain-containing protein [Roseomonas sp. AR75]|uniref:DUF421 domain-containing protein n=1 Tax=Roseomonas sp. AR75 TaxID=2562311 RepID=UPI0010BFA9C8|nr:YetF domain-containing protein [Roseomonas sp. AR75]
MLFDDWAGIGRTLLVGVLAYVALVAMLRVSGKRTLSKMNAFDLVVTVALGSTLATILLSPDTALAEGLVALALLIGLQRVVAAASVRSEGAQAFVKATPALLLLRGRMLSEALRRERVTTEEVLAALRADGLARPEDAAAVVLETDGTLTVLRNLPEQGAGTLGPVRGWPG